MDENSLANKNAGIYEDRKSHPYCIWDTLHSAPEEMRACLSQNVLDAAQEAAREVVKRKIERVIFTGTGSSFGPGIYGTYALSEIADLATKNITSYEFVHYPQGGLGEKDCLVCISHSGGTQVIIQSAQKAKQAGALVVAITDIPTSGLAKEADKLVIGPGGRGWPIPTTRSYLADLFCVLIFNVAIGEQKKPGTMAKWMKEMKRIPDLVEQSIEVSDKLVPDYAKVCAKSIGFYVAADGPNCATSYDGALKIQEIAWKPAIGNEAEEAIHGPLMPIEDTNTVVLVAPEGNGYERVERIAKAMHTAKVPVFAISKENASIKQYATYFVGIPGNMPELITPLVYIIPLFELAYWVAVYNGHNPDSLKRDDPIRKQAHLIMTPPGTH